MYDPDNVLNGIVMVQNGRYHDPIIYLGFFQLYPVINLDENQTDSAINGDMPGNKMNQPLLSNEEICIGEKKKIPSMHIQPNDFELETTTVWSFRSRGSWATHSSEYRGNWSPRVARNLILRYSAEGETVLDPFIGGGTTLIETKLLNRNGIGIDINEEAVKITMDKINFDFQNRLEGISQTVMVGDARNLEIIEDGSIDLALLHPPYSDIIHYSNHPKDLSMIHEIKEFLSAMQPVAKEIYRVLKNGRHCALLIGDTRRHKHYVPIATRLMDVFLDAGFILKEDIIKHQWNCKSTPFWKEKSVQSQFLLLAHEHLFVFRKPDNGEDMAIYRESMR